ncbi:MAG: hypothetical protein HYY86_02745 [Candidatus Harrisonbacteria bacterium]|nr:hypothetical protein [Candidatus Harrisonbacteria bacterium]
MAKRPDEDTEPRVQQLFIGPYWETDMGSQDLAGAGFSIYMALTKCNECGGEVSDKASICPHCGNPIHTEPNSIINPPPLPISEINIEEKPGILFKITYTILWIFAVLIIVFVLILVIGPFILPNNLYKDLILQELTNSPTNLFQKQWWQEFQQKIPQTKDSSPTSSTKIIFNPKLISDSKFSFYTLNVGKNEDHNISYRDEQGIIKLLNTINYPPKLTQNLIIIFINPDDVTSDMILVNPDKTWLNFSDNRTAEGGLYATNKNWHWIEINKPVPSFTGAILIHELGHRVATELTQQEWDNYYKLRGISANTSRNINNWILSPQEDFAEVFKYIFRQGDPKISVEWQIRTQYGNVIPTNELIEPVITGCDSLFGRADQKKLQSCRNANSGALDWVGRPLYFRVTDSATEQFIRNIIKRLLQ